MKPAHPAIPVSPTTSRPPAAVARNCIAATAAESGTDCTTMAGSAKQGQRRRRAGHVSRRVGQSSAHTSCVSGAPRAAAAAAAAAAVVAAAFAGGEWAGGGAGGGGPGSRRRRRAAPGSLSGPGHKIGTFFRRKTWGQRFQERVLVHTPILLALSTTSPSISDAAGGTATAAPARDEACSAAEAAGSTSTQRGRAAPYLILSGPRRKTANFSDANHGNKASRKEYWSGYRCQSAAATPAPKRPPPPQMKTCVGGATPPSLSWVAISSPVTA